MNILRILKLQYVQYNYNLGYSEHNSFCFGLVFCRYNKIIIMWHDNSWPIPLYTVLYVCD